MAPPIRVPQPTNPQQALAQRLAEIEARLRAIETALREVT
jgi:hypothetical protein